MIQDMVLAYLFYYFVPHRKNNHKAKILHTSSLASFMVLLLLLQVALHFAPRSSGQVLGYAAQISRDEVVRLTNEKRSGVGVGAVSFNATLSAAAQKKAEHMLANDYWAHVAPDGTEPWYFFTNSGYKYKYAGENLARDFSSAIAAVDAWMASPSHKDNLLSSKYKEIGIGVAEGDLSGVDTTIIVQLFGTPVSDSVAQVPVAKANTAIASAGSPTPTVAPSATVTPTPIDNIVVTDFASGPPEPLGESASSNSFYASISSFDTTKAISFSIIGLLSVATVIDGAYIAFRKIPRVAGRSLAHFAFLGMILLIVIVARSGQIL
jgi:uncharacterized protein YkwD